MTTRSILMVEDNLDDTELLREAITESARDVVIIAKTTVHAALEWLLAQTETTLPGLVITDHHLPDHHGHELIAALRGCVRNQRLTVVMLSGDIQRPAGLDNVTWFSKPDTWNGWRKLAEQLLTYHLAHG